MSATEIYGFDKEGVAYHQDDVHNSWRGAMAIWNILEEKYLGPYRPTYVPKHVPDDQVEAFLGYKPTRCSASMDPGAMKEVWALARDERVSDTDKIVLCSTFDNVVVMKANMPELIQAFEEFEGVTSLDEQAAIIKEMLADEDCIGVAWNQTSVNLDVWVHHERNEETEEYDPYNVLTGTKHWSMLKSEGGEENASN